MILDIDGKIVDSDFNNNTIVYNGKQYILIEPTLDRIEKFLRQIIRKKKLEKL